MNTDRSQSFIDLLRTSLGVLKSDPVIVVPLTIFLFLTEFFAVFSKSMLNRSMSISLVLIFINLMIAFYLKVFVFLSTAQILQKGRISLDVLKTQLMNIKYRLLSVAILLSLPSTFFSYYTTEAVFNESFQPTTMSYVWMGFFVCYAIYTLFLVIYLLFMKTGIWATVVQTFQFLASYAGSLFRHLSLLVLTLFFLLLGFSIFFMVPSIGPVLSILLFGVLTTLFYIYVTVYFLIKNNIF